MKKTLLLILIAVMTCTFTASSAQVRMYPRASLDYLTYYKMKVVQPMPPSSGYDELAIIMNYGNIRTRVGCSVDIGKRISLNTEQVMYLQSNNLVSYSPVQGEWTVGISLKISQKIKIGYEHLCIHPLKTDGRIFNQVYGGGDYFSISYGY